VPAEEDGLEEVAAQFVANAVSAGMSSRPTSPDAFSAVEEEDEDPRAAPLPPPKPADAGDEDWPPLPPVRVWPLPEGAAAAAAAFASAGGEDPRARPKPLPNRPLVLRCEEKAEEWHFDDDVHAAKLEALRKECARYRERERVARERDKVVRQEGEARVAEILAAAHEGDLKDGCELSRMRTEMLELEDERERIEEETGVQVAELDRLMAAEAARRVQLEDEIRAERAQAPSFKAREAASEDEEAKAVRELDGQLRQSRADVQSEVLSVQRDANERVRRIEVRLREDIVAVQAEIDQVLRETRGAVGATLAERQRTCASTERRRADVDAELRVKLGEAHSKVMNTRERSLQKVKEAQVRDLAMEAHLRETAEAAFRAAGCAEEEARRAAHYEHKNRLRTVEATMALGETFPRSTQYSLTLDGRTRSALKATARSVLTTPRPGSSQGRGMAA